MTDTTETMSGINTPDIDHQIMMRRKARYNCAAATLCGILAAVGNEVDDDTLKHLSAGLAGGIGKTHAEGTCGAITGAVFALGLLSEGDDGKTARFSAELFNGFRERLGTTVCRELKSRERATPCDLCCLTAGRLVYEMMEREGLVHHCHHGHEH